MAMTRRREERVSVARPVRLDRGTGVTKNISASGVFFETDVDFTAGSKISFAIEIDGPQGKKLILKCQGEIVRVQREGSKVGVAASITASKVQSAD